MKIPVVTVFGQEAEVPLDLDPEIDTVRSLLEALSRPSATPNSSARLYDPFLGHKVFLDFGDGQSLSNQRGRRPFTQDP